MKTLLVSLYDCTTSCAAAVVDEFGAVVPVELSRNLYHAIYDTNCSWISLSDEDTKKKIVKVNKLYDQYDHVIICEDGTIKVIK